MWFRYVINRSTKLGLEEISYIPFVLSDIYIYICYFIPQFNLTQNVLFSNTKLTNLEKNPRNQKL